MAKQDDLYSPDEAAKALGILTRQIFAMLANGELEGHQDEWARWHIPASAVRRARQEPELSSDLGGSTEDEGEPRASSSAARGGDAATTVDYLSDRGPLRKPPGGVDAPGNGVTAKADEEPLRDERQQGKHKERPPPSGIHADSSEAETADGLWRGEYRETSAPDKTTRKSSSNLSYVLGLVSVALLVAGLSLGAFYVLNQGPQDTATNSSDPEGFNVPEIDAPQETVDEAADAPADKTLRVTIPRMERVKDAPVPDTIGEDEESLKNYVGIHLQGTGFPWQEEANVYIAGHRLGYPGTPSWLGFWDLDNLEEGDEIFVTDANDKEYSYRVFSSFVADPTEVWVTELVSGKNIVTLQTCTLPEYSQRLIVQAELVEEA